ncbi:hypothetical protein Pelo_793 [Pelomyxa schiedti]|nr:hypothetical protein Pelo_793 [Pelomyxa schiedti]
MPLNEPPPRSRKVLFDTLWSMFLDYTLWNSYVLLRRWQDHETTSVRRTGVTDPQRPAANVVEVSGQTNDTQDNGNGNGNDSDSDSVDSDNRPMGWLGCVTTVGPRPDVRPAAGLAPWVLGTHRLLVVDAGAVRAGVGGGRDVHG